MFSKYKTFLLVISFILTMSVFGVFVFNLPSVKSVIKSKLYASKIEPVCKDCNIILVAIDTVSAQHLPCYGYTRNTAPNLCAFAEKNIIFENAYTNSYWTLPSDIALFTGLFPSKTNILSPTDKLAGDIAFLPQFVKNYGYNSHFFAPKDDVAFPFKGVYDRLGNSFYNDNNISWNNSLETFKKSVRAGNKTFLYLHSYATHAPYIIGDEKQIYQPYNTKLPTSWREFTDDFEITPEIAERVVEDAKKGVEVNVSWAQNRELTQFFLDQLLAVSPDFEKEKPILEKMRNEGLLWYQNVGAQKYEKLVDQYNPADVEMLKALYDQTINILDRDQIPLLTKLIYDPEFKKNTIVVIYSEHGQEFMEHDHLYHATLYNPNVKIPLIMYVPNIYNKKITSNVQLADMFPTLMELISVDVNENFDGKSFVGNLFNDSERNDVIEIDGTKLESKALVLGEWKLFLSKQEDNTYLPYELYNVKEDPEEKNNLVFSRTDIKDKIMDAYKLGADGRI